MTIENRLRWIVIGTAFVATCCTYAEQNLAVPETMRGPAYVLDTIALPAFVLSALIGGNTHSPPAFLHYGLVFVTYVLLLILALLLIFGFRSFVRRRDA